MERLQKVIANSGYCSRRKAEELMKLGLVLVNGKVVSELGYKVEKSDAIEVEGITLKVDEKKYILLYKPRGVVTTTNDEKNRKTVIDLIKEDVRVYPVGRLDYDTTGILLLTNDGELTNLLTHPKTKINKEYVAKVSGFVTKEKLNNLRRGILIDGVKTAKANVKLKKYDKKKDSSYITLIIHEGKNHQIKKMFEAIGHEVLKLKRERFSELDLSGLSSGEYRYLSIKEVKKLYSDTKK